MSAVQIVAVNYYGSRALGTLVKSLQCQDDGAWRLMVVDNSCDRAERDRLEHVASIDSRVTIHTAPDNLGYFGGAHWLISNTSTGRPTWVVVCNVDLRLEPTFIRNLRARTPTHPVLAPAVVAMPRNRALNPYMVARPTVRAMRIRRLAFSTRPLAAAYMLMGLVKSQLRRRPATMSISTPIYAPHGSIIVFHQSYFDAGGSLDHPVWLYAEELTVAERCRQLGLTVMYEPRLQAIHDEHQATGGIWKSRRLAAAQRDATRYGLQLIKG